MQHESRTSANDEARDFGKVRVGRNLPFLDSPIGEVLLSVYPEMSTFSEENLNIINSLIQEFLFTNDCEGFEKLACFLKDPLIQSLLDGFKEIVKKNSEEIQDLEGLSAFLSQRSIDILQSISATSKIIKDELYTEKNSTGHLCGQLVKIGFK